MSKMIDIEKEFGLTFIRRKPREWSQDFVEEIKKRYDYTNPRTRQVISALEYHLVHISVRRDGNTEYSCR